MKLIIDFSGWLKIEASDVMLQDVRSGEVCSLKEFHKRYSEEDPCFMEHMILEDFGNAYQDAMDLEFADLDLTIEDED